MAQTANYQLPLHEPYTRPSAQGWNENQRRLDQIVKNLADTLSTLTATVSEKADQSAVDALNQRVDIVFGSYSGTGTESRTINLGFKPKAVLVERDNAQRFIADKGVIGGLAIPGCIVRYAGTVALEIAENGFRVFQIGVNAYTNGGGLFYYIAFR